MPREWEGCYRSKVQMRYQRRQEKMITLVMKVFLRGVSGRKVQEVLVFLLEAAISAQMVSQIARSLAKEVQWFQHWPLLDHRCYMILGRIAFKVEDAKG